MFNRKIKNKKNIKKINKRILKIFIVLFFIFTLLFLINKIFLIYTPPKTTFLDKNLSFRKIDESVFIIENEIKNIKNSSIIFESKDDDFKEDIKIKDIILIKNEEEIINNLKNKNLKIINTLNLFFNNVFKNKEYNLDYEIKDNFIDTLKFIFSPYEEKIENSRIVIEDSNYSITEDKNGRIFVWGEVKEKLKSKFNENNFYNLKINLNKEIKNPKIKKEDLENYFNNATSILNNNPIKLKYKEAEYLLNKEDLLDLIKFDYIFEKEEFLKVIIKIDKVKMFEILDRIAKENDKNVEEGELIIENDKVISFKPILNGYSLDKEASFEIIENKILDLKNEIDLIITEIIPEATNSEVVKYGLIDKLGEGESNFYGSSRNRIHNIELGSSYVNGTLVKPGEEFSLINTLGVISSEKGYLPELVIKGNETIKEYGGGLCQVGTTTFRVALSAGLPIIERRNHSYRVSFYEPAGTDATIYYPKPDMRFLNDTPNYILIMTEIDDYDLKYTIWGTYDDRKITITEPIIKNIVSPPPTKWTDTCDLEEGEVKCTELAHNGADAEFDYIVEYKDGEKKEVTFKSHYVPWQQVCLRGKSEEICEQEANENE
ncbi:VanW family protein [Patescibacteria group bacterium]|nr:VanW family protein [Patescibacteria group bacterium]